MKDVKQMDGGIFIRNVGDFYGTTQFYASLMHGMPFERQKK